MSEKLPISDVQSLMTALAATRAELDAAAGARRVGPAAVDDEEALDVPPGAPPELDMLRTQQRFALEALLAGRSYVEAARAGGVDRRTLHRWLNQDAAFGRALEACRRRAMSRADEQLAAATQGAAATLAQAAHRDFRAAAVLLRGRGLLPGLGRHGASGARPATVVEVPVAAVPPGRLRDFEVRLRELILSFREEPEKPVGGEGAASLCAEGTETQRHEV